MRDAAKVHTAWTTLSEGEAAAAFIIGKTDGETWSRWKASGRAVDFVYRHHPGKRQQGEHIRSYPNLAAIPPVSRADAKWVWRHREELEVLAEQGQLRLGHPSNTRQAYRDVSGATTSKRRSERGIDAKRVIAAFVQRHHNDPSPIIDAILALVEASGATRGRAALDAMRQD